MAEEAVAEEAGRRRRWRCDVLGRIRGRHPAPGSLDTGPSYGVHRDDDHGVADLDAVAIGQGRQRVDPGSVDGGSVRAPQIGDAEAFPVNGEAEVTARDLLVGEQQPLDLPSCIEGIGNGDTSLVSTGLTDEELERGHAAITQPAPPGALRAARSDGTCAAGPTPMPPNASATPAPLPSTAHRTRLVAVGT